MFDGKSIDPELVERIRDTLVSRRASQFQFVAGLVRTPSASPPGDMAAVSELTDKALKKLGFGVERHAVAEDDAAKAGFSNITNLVVRHEFASGPVIALGATGDTVAAGDGWTVDSLSAEIKSGVLFGLGAVHKADLAVFAHALAALRDAGPDLSGTIELHFTFDGCADGDLGPGWLLKNGIVNPDYAITSGFSYGIGTSAMGDLQMQVILEGMDSGGTADPMEATNGVLSTLYQARDDCAQIRSAVPGIEQPTLVIGHIEGGSRPDVRPDRVSFTLDRGLIPDEDVAAVEADLTERIAVAASRFDGIQCRIRRVKLSKPMQAGPGTDKLTGCLERQAAEVLGGPVWVYGVPYDPGSRHYAALGIPTVLYGAGPGTAAEARIRSADEQLVLDDLRKATEVMALTLAEFMTPAA